MDNFVIMDQLTCRTCLSNAEISNSLHDSVDFFENKIELKEILWKFSRILIDWNKPIQLARICTECTEKLLKAYEFFLQVEGSEKRLNDYFVDVKKSKEEEEEEQSNNFPQDIDSPSIEMNEPTEPEDDEMMELLKLKTEAGTRDCDLPKLPSVTEFYHTFEESKIGDDKPEPERTLQSKEEAVINEIADVSKKKAKSKTKAPKTKREKKAGKKEPVVDEPTEEKELVPEKPFQCDTCARLFLKKETLARHQKCHLGSGSFQCSHCARSFTKKDNLLRHMISHKVSEDVPKKHKYRRGLCPHCGESFPEASLIIHIRRHTGETPYKCDICDKGYPRLQDLTLHKRLHTGEKPHVCLTCGKAFSRTNSLARHIRVHTGERPYKCNQCDKSFAQSNDLNLHIRRHTGEKPYKCGVCNKNFINGSILKNHRKVASHYEDEDKGPDRYEKIRVTNPHRAFWTTKGNEKNLIKDKDIQDLNITTIYDEEGV